MRYPRAVPTPVKIASAAGALALSLLSVPLPAAAQPGDAATGGGLASFTADAQSYPEAQSANVGSVLPLTVSALLTETRAHIDSQPRSQGYAGVVDIPIGELLGVLGIPVTLPTYCYANWPGTGSAQCGALPTQGAGSNALIGAGDTSAGGDFNDATRDGASSEVAATGFSTPVMSVGASTSKSDTKVGSNGSVTATTSASIGHINIGGVIDIASVDATATASAAGSTGTAKSSAQLVIHGVTIAGVPVTITPQGLQVGPVFSLPPVPVIGVPLPSLPTAVTVPLPALTGVTQVVNTALQKAGLSISVLGPPTLKAAADGSAAQGSVTGLQITYTDSKTGNGFGVTFGYASASVTATPQVGSSSSDTSGTSDSGQSATSAAGTSGGEASPTGGDIAGATAISPGSTSAGSSGGVSAPALGTLSGPGAQSRASGSPSSRSPLAVLVGDPLVGRFRDIYEGGLLSTLIVVGACIALMARRSTMFAHARRRPL